MGDTWSAAGSKVFCQGRLVLMSVLAAHCDLVPRVCASCRPRRPIAQEPIRCVPRSLSLLVSRRVERARLSAMSIERRNRTRLPRDEFVIYNASADASAIYYHRPANMSRVKTSSCLMLGPPETTISRQHGVICLQWASAGPSFLRNSGRAPSSDRSRVPIKCGDQCTVCQNQQPLPPPHSGSYRDLGSSPSVTEYASGTSTGAGPRGACDSTGPDASTPPVWALAMTQRPFCLRAHGLTPLHYEPSLDPASSVSGKNSLPAGGKRHVSPIA